MKDIFENLGIARFFESEVVQLRSQVTLPTGPRCWLIRVVHEEAPRVWRYSCQALPIGRWPMWTELLHEDEIESTGLWFNVPSAAEMDAWFSAAGLGSQVEAGCLPKPWRHPLPAEKELAKQIDWLDEHLRSPASASRITS